MNFLKLILRDGGKSCFQSASLFLFIIVLGFIGKNFILFLLICLVIITLLVGINFLKDYLKYKDETLDQREKRLKTKELIKEWQKRYH